MLNRTGSALKTTSRLCILPAFPLPRGEALLRLVQLYETQ